MDHDIALEYENYILKQHISELVNVVAYLIGDNKASDEVLNIMSSSLNCLGENPSGVLH